MENLAKLSRDYDNWYCSFCKCHYAGHPKKLKFFTKQEWDKMITEDWAKEDITLCPVCREKGKWVEAGAPGIGGSWNCNNGHSWGSTIRILEPWEVI